MIEKLGIEPIQSVATNHCIINKINEIIDYINHSNHEYESIDDVVEDFVKVNETAHKFRFTNEQLRKELDRTRKALDKAKWWLNEIVENHRYTPISTAEMALKEITALEQKDVKCE